MCKLDLFAVLEQVQRLMPCILLEKDSSDADDSLVAHVANNACDNSRSKYLPSQRSCPAHSSPSVAKTYDGSTTPTMWSSTHSATSPEHAADTQCICNPAGGATQRAMLPVALAASSRHQQEDTHCRHHNSNSLNNSHCSISGAERHPETGVAAASRLRTASSDNKSLILPTHCSKHQHHNTDAHPHPHMHSKQVTAMNDATPHICVECGTIAAAARAIGCVMQFSSVWAAESSGDTTHAHDMHAVNNNNNTNAHIYSNPAGDRVDEGRALLIADGAARCQQLYLQCWDILHSGHWQTADIAIRNTIALLAAVAAALSITLCHMRCGAQTAAQVEEAQRCTACHEQWTHLLDITILLAAPHTKDLLQHVLETVSVVSVTAGIRQAEGIALPPHDYAAPARAAISAATQKDIRTTPPVLHCPSLEDFRRRAWEPQVPVIVKGVVSGWPASGPAGFQRSWRDLSQLTRRFGTRLIPVEVGKNYMSDDWYSTMCTLADFVDDISAACGSKTPGYMAQHTLLDQIPELRQDIIIPDYCLLSEDPSSDLDPLINVWLGPGGTVSCLHHDSYHNLFAQVKGTKRFILFEPHASNMYPAAWPLQNTSRVDPSDTADVISASFPDFPPQPDYDFMVEEGDMLFLPAGWWHYVKAVDPSVSVSFWWT